MGLDDPYDPSDTLPLMRKIREKWIDFLKWSTKPTPSKILDGVMWGLLGLNFGVFIGCAWKHMLGSVLLNGGVSLMLIYTVHERGRIQGMKEGWNLFHDQWVLNMDQLNEQVKEKHAQGYVVTGINIKGPSERVQ